MEKITQFEITTSYGEIVEHVLIDHGDGAFSSMPKATYDAQQAVIKDVPASKS